MPSDDGATSAKETPQSKVREVTHITVKEGDFTGGVKILQNRRGWVRGWLGFLNLWLHAIVECHDQGFGFDPRTAWVFAHVTMNVSERVRNA